MSREELEIYEKQREFSEFYNDIIRRTSRSFSRNTRGLLSSTKKELSAYSIIDREYDSKDHYLSTIQLNTFGRLRHCLSDLYNKLVEVELSYSNTR